uniref:BED-type domain-containing protein n=1 Tax=Rhizophagus irregularis (strain DAOM 181602 / DAOM 197198 / MUCL 43194) TaxID=747089 RepID=U9SXD0_RHIID
MSSTVSEVRRGRKESHVWDHYFKEPLGSGHYTARCHYCNQNWSRGKPEILKSHLALYCKDVPLSIKSEYMEMLAIGSTSTNRKQKLDTDSSAAEIDADKKDKIDQALIRFFICCGIPFSTVGHPYFIDFVQSLCFAYNPPKRSSLSTTILNKETAIVLKKIKEELKYEKNLTLAVDGWSDLLERSIYAFIIITPGKRQYIHTLKDTSVYSHTGFFNATEIENVLTTIGPKKFAAVVSDAESAMQMARRLISENDIIKLDFAKNTLKKCQSIITFFKTSYRAGANLQKDIIQTLTEGGGLKTSVKTRWSTAWDCCDSIIHLENNLKNVNVEQLRAVLAPAKRAVQAIEANASNMFDTDTYLVAFFLHPRYRDNGFQDKIFHQMALTAMKIWSKFGGNTNSCTILLSQLRSYGDNEPPYDMEYTDEYDTPELWWSVVNMLDINRLESMAQIHSYYITNAKVELKFSSSNLSEDELETALREVTTAMINNDDLFTDDDDEEENDDVASNDGIIEDDTNNNFLMTDIMNLNDFREQIDENSDSRIQQSDELVDYKDSDIDFEAILDDEELSY